MKSSVLQIAVLILGLAGVTGCSSNDSNAGSGGSAQSCGGSGGSAGSGGSGGVSPDAPVVKIISPTEGATLNSGDAITVKGTANDPQEGNMTDPARLFWFSNQAPDPIGEGAEDALKPGEIPAGTTIVKFTATDLDCNTSSTQVNVTVQ